MEFDIISITEEEYEALTTVQKKLVRTAQKSKNKLEHEMEQELLEFKKLLLADNMYNSSLYAAKQAELQGEIDYEVAVLAEQLEFNMALNEPTTDDETGNEGGDESAGYIVDYELSYLERYIIVRDYYLAIEDSSERMALYAADTTAQAYLGSYYSTLYDYLATLS